MNCTTAMLPITVPAIVVYLMHLYVFTYNCVNIAVLVCYGNDKSLLLYKHTLVQKQILPLMGINLLAIK